MKQYSMSVNFISLVAYYVWLQAAEGPSKAYSMCFKLASYIATSVLTGR